MIVAMHKKERKDPIMKKLLALMMVLAMCMTLVSVPVASAADDLPDQISIFIDGTVVTAENGQPEFEARWEQLVEEKFGKKIDLVITQPDHDAYFDVLQQQVASGEWPDVFIMPTTYYSSYAANGVLWDMTEAWENSQTKNSGRFKGDNTVEMLKIDGKLYGFSATIGNGSVTYIKKAWMDAVGITEAPTNWEEYTAMLDKFVNDDPDGDGQADTYGLSAAGFIGPEAPYVNYLPEFYWDAFPSFYQDDEGVWHDGFTEPAMEGALARLNEGYTKKWLDPTTLTNGTKDVREKFYDDTLGVFTYWAATWATNNKNNLEANGHDGELIAIPPLAEAQPYFDRMPPAWCISTACANPQGVFDVFIDTMLDGGAMQELWTYGVQGFHWDTKAETVLDKTYEEGQFHMLENPNSPGTLYTKNHIDPALSLADFADPAYDHMADVVQPEAIESEALFMANSRPAQLVPTTDEMSMYNGDLTTLKNQLIANVTMGELTYEEAMAKFEADHGAEWSKAIVDSLNAL